MLRTNSSFHFSRLSTVILIGASAFSSPAHAVQVTSLSLVNADTGKVIQRLSSGSVIDLSSLPTKNISILANTDSTTASVKFGYYDGNTTTDKFQIENKKPFCFKGDSNGKCTAFAFGLGERSITATGYSKSKLYGTSSPPLSVRVSFVNGSVGRIDKLSLVDMKTGNVIDSQIDSGEEISVPSLSDKCLSVQANIESGNVDRVVFNSSEMGQVTENIIPYDLMGDDGERGCLSSGNQSVKATPYTLSGDKAFAGAPVSRSFVLKPASAPTPSWTSIYGEGQTVDGAYYRVHSIQKEHSIRKSPSGSAYRFEIREGEARISGGDDGKERSELNGSPRKYPPGTDIWVAYSFKVEKGEAATGEPNFIGQWHGITGVPNFSIRMPYDNMLRIQYANDSGSYVAERKTDFQRDRWYNVVVQTRFSTTNAVLKVWIDGELIVSRTGFSMAYASSDYYYWKFGIYRSRSSHQTMAAQFANMEVSTSSLYERVSSPKPVLP